MVSALECRLPIADCRKKKKGAAPHATAPFDLWAPALVDDGLVVEIVKCFRLHRGGRRTVRLQ